MDHILLAMSVPEPHPPIRGFGRVSRVRRLAAVEPLVGRRSLCTPYVPNIGLRCHDGQTSGGGVMGLLEGKKALIVGVGNQRSIAWGIATAFQREGAKLAFTYLNDRFKDNVTKLVETLPDHDQIPVLLCDAAKPEDVKSLFAEVEKRWGGLDILVHSIAYAPV